MVDTFHKHQLSESSFGMGLILKWPAKFLYTHISFEVVVVRWATREKDAIDIWEDVMTVLHPWFEHEVKSELQNVPDYSLSTRANWS